jgi:putative transposase
VAVFIDAIMVKVRDGQVANRPVYAAIGVTLDGGKDVLGLWMGVGGEGAKFWMSVLTDLRNRGVRDVFFLVCDGLKGLPDVVEHVWPQTVVQTCIIHLIRNTFRLSSRADHDALKKDLRAIYTAPTADAAEFALEELEEKWGKKYRAIIRLWRNAFDRCRRDDVVGLFQAAQGHTRMTVLPLRRSVGLSAGTASSRVVTVPMCVRRRPSRTRSTISTS